MLKINVRVTLAHPVLTRLAEYQLVALGSNHGFSYSACHHGNLVTEYCPAVLREASLPTNSLIPWALSLFKGIQLCLPLCWEALVPFEKLSRVFPLSKFWLLEVRGGQWHQRGSFSLCRGRNVSVVNSCWCFQTNHHLTKPFLSCSTTKNLITAFFSFPTSTSRFNIPATDRSNTMCQPAKQPRNLITLTSNYQSVILQFKSK